MKNLKRTAIAFAVVVFLAPSIQSCKKVSPRKLDGDWKMTSGVVKTTEINEDGEVRNTTRTYNGEKETITRTFSFGTPFYSDPAPTTFNMSYNFDKKAGVYTQVVVKVEEYTSSYEETFRLDENNNRIDFLDVARKTTEELKSTYTGDFSITGGNGDVKKNSQFILRQNNENYVSNKTFKYYDNSNKEVVAAGRYYAGQGNKPESLKTTDTETSSITGNTSVGTVFTVDELKKGVMEISATEMEKTVSGPYTEEESTNTNWTLTQD